MPVSPHCDGLLGDHTNEEHSATDDLSVCLLQGRPTIKVVSLRTEDRWLFDTGAGMSVISEDLFKRMFPTPKLKKVEFPVTGANNKPVNVLGMAKLPIKVLNEQTTVEVLVSPELSYKAILGMDAIRKLNLVLNPRTLKYSRIKDASVCAVSLQTYRVPPLCGRPIKVKLSGPVADGNAVVSTPTKPIIDKLFVPEAMTSITDNVAVIMIKNCNTHEIMIPAKTLVCDIEMLHENEISINAADIKPSPDTPMPTPLDAKATREFIKHIRMNVPDAYRDRYVSLFTANYDIFSTNKSDLGRASNFEHNIRLKSSQPIYRKQFRIPDAHQNSLHKQIDEWVKMGIIEPCFSRYNSPIFIVPKKDGSFRFVLDYRALNENSLDDRYNMKDVGECIGEIGRACSTIFSTMDLTSGFWQLPLEKASRPLTAFTCPGKGQFCYNVLSMGLKGGPGSFQRMMELTMKNIPNVIVYIDDLLAHTASHDDHLKTLQAIFNRLRNNNIKLNPDKCEFGATSVQYLGFRLTPKGILPGKDKLQAVRDMQPPSSVTEVRQFLGLCNYFRTHVRNFSTLAGPLNFLTSKKAGWRGGPLPPDAKASFHSLKGALISEPVVAYPRSDRQFHLYVDAATGGANNCGGFGAILGQLDSQNQLQVVAYASRSLKDHEKNYTPYLAELNAAAWAIDNFDVYLRGRKFILYTDHKPMVIKKSIHQKTLNRLEERMGMYDFQVVYKKGATMPADVLSRKPVVNSITTDYSYKAAADNDLFCQDVERYLLTKSLPNDPIRAKILHQVGPHCFKENDILKLRAGHSDLIILPRSLANAAIDNAHGTLLTGHGGIDKTVARIRQLYYWPSIIVDVRQRLSECPRCQKALKSAPMGETLHPLPLCSEPNQRIHCDLFGPLKTPDGKGHVLCITDAFTRYAELCVVDNKEASTIATAIITNWICRFGIPDQIFSDGGKEFANKLLAQICDFLQIAKNKTTPAHPQCNAQVEVVNKTIKKYLATMTENALDWKPLIPTLAFAYNTTTHNTTGYSPSHLMFGYQPKYSTNTTLPDSHNDTTDNLLRHLFLNRQLATKNALANSDKYKQRHDDNILPIPVSPGQFVFLDKRMFLNTNEKIDDKWEGPYVVAKVFSNGTLDLIRKGRSIRVNKQRVKPFTAMGQVKTVIPDLPPNLQDNPSDNFLMDDINPDLPTQPDPSVPNTPPSPPPLSRNRRRGPTDTFTTPNPSLTPNAPSSALPAPVTDQPMVRKPGRPRKTVQAPTNNEPVPSLFSSPHPAQTANVPPQTAPSLPQATNSRFGPHSMVLRSHTANPTVSHLRIAALNTSTNIPKIKRLNAIVIRKFAKLINSLAHHPILDEYALPKQVTNHSYNKQVERRRRYLKSLCPTHRNTLLTGDPLFSFDPIVYEYVWSSARPPLPPELRQYFEHLPDVPDFPQGALIPLAPPNADPPPRPASAPPLPYDDHPFLIPLNEPALAIPQRPRSASPSYLHPGFMDVDPLVEFPPDNLHYPEAFFPPDYQPYVPPYIPPLPQPPQPQQVAFDARPAIAHSSPPQPNQLMWSPPPAQAALQYPAPSLPVLYHPASTSPHALHPYCPPPLPSPSRLQQLGAQLPPLSLPQLLPADPTTGPPAIPPFSVAGSNAPTGQGPLPKPSLSHSGTQQSPTTPTVDASFTHRMREALRRFPVRRYKLPASHPSRRHPAFASPTSTSQPHHSTPSGSTLPPTLHVTLSSSASSDPPLPALNYSDPYPLPITYHVGHPPSGPPSLGAVPAAPLPDGDCSMALAAVPQPASVLMDSHWRRNSPLMSFGSRSSSNASMPSPPVYMDDAPILPFSTTTGPQFSDLNPTPASYIRPPRFNSYRDSRTTPDAVLPNAPRFVDEYGRPFIQWPPAHPSQSVPPAAPGTFDNLHIHESTRQLAPTAPSALPLTHHPGWTSHSPVNPQHLVPYGQPIFPATRSHRRQASQSLMVRPSLQQLAPPNSPSSFALVPVTEQPMAAAQSYTLVQLPAQPDRNSPPSQRPRELSRTPSIDAVGINAVTTQSPPACVATMPPQLSTVEKVMAFLGNDRLLARRALRKSIKQRPSSS
jgi:predicted aspartyl protease